ncbi:bifunctional folylpolyglutamate synthase/dihydrofolate synthase [Alienimonas chondri]|uniref:Dihydrofolate synthase/folylpolyglutamate synthase n=1 Tax=Alienimonas chondri TaxID=2681879 RepID=A0ABX1VGF4_9PLAN|nr:cyanophycin synthetase [Alienimonas chondri]NNJ26630.1 Folylpolyglutamate synthase [Alienimonas chondri]
MPPPLRPRDAIRTREQAERFLLGRVNYERRPIPPDALRLDGVRALLGELGAPQLRVPAVHIAGTKGKGTVAALVAAALTANGLKCGLFTSPHLSRFEERLVVDGVEPDEATFVRLVTDVAAAAQRAEANGAAPTTFFEMCAALGFLHFARSECDVAALEVGLGGRLDATNVCEPVVCAITSISRDHTSLLGHTHAAIAGEKAGIAKPGVPLIWGGGPGDAEHAVRARCEAVGAPFLSTGLSTGAPAPHQRANAATAVAILDALRSAGWSIDPEVAAAGMAAVRLPGRAERFPPPTNDAGEPIGPAVLIDVAHNWASATALAETLRTAPESGRRCLVLACAKDKDAAGLLRTLLPHVDDLVCTQFVSNPRAIPPSELASLARSLTDAPIRCDADPRSAWAGAVRRAGVGGLAIAAGSFFLIAELRPEVAGATS